MVELALPPLRERDDDVIELAVFLLDKARKQLARAPLDLSREALDAIRRYHWPGNVRELSNAIERAVILCEEDIITPDLLAIDHRVTSASTAADLNDKLSLEEYFRVFVLEHQDQMTETELAQALGISRKTLWERRQRFGLPRTQKAQLICRTGTSRLLAGNADPAPDRQYFRPFTRGNTIVTFGNTRPRKALPNHPNQACAAHQSPFKSLISFDNYRSNPDNRGVWQPALRTGNTPGRNPTMTERNRSTRPEANGLRQRQNREHTNIRVHNHNRGVIELWIQKLRSTGRRTFASWLVCS